MKRQEQRGARMPQSKGQSTKTLATRAIRRMLKSNLQRDPESVPTREQKPRRGWDS